MMAQKLAPILRELLQKEGVQLYVLLLFYYSASMWIIPSIPRKKIEITIAIVFLM